MTTRLNPLKNQSPLSSSLIAFLLGSTASAGFLLSGMILPQKTFDFFSIQGLQSGSWDPSLLFTFCGALGTNVVLYHATRATCNKPLVGNSFQLPSVSTIDKKLIGGAALFGLGWGIGGFCPGPAIASIGLGNVLPAASIFAGFLTALLLEGKTTPSEIVSKNNNYVWIATLLATMSIASYVAPFSGFIFPSFSCSLFSGLQGGLLGGSLIGASVGLYMLLEGKVFGFSGVLRGLIDPNQEDKKPRYAVLLGLVLTAMALSRSVPMLAPAPRVRDAMISVF
eukprot:TRINITY_DN1165_c0_g1_i1.p1 TRINITY_DN1165_c0_g1~~TRINITY_DN1165_c0_g1_i1.p1  ORF type:complete len:281 (+),score=65.77 TRINITY_DN1165_c0_g1_i1:273-1115(+)